jgi:glycerol dehydrogenase-like iron-containing ADH family enzyme
MNGYTSRTASITQHGHKLTLPAQAPVGAFFDLAVLAAAPKRMIRAGLAAAGNPLTAEAIHLTRDFYERALLHGREIRNRYTIVDLSAQSGVLQRALASL